MKNKDFIPINKMFTRIKKFSKVYTIFDKLTFFHILAIWSIIIVIFGLAYFFLSGRYSYIIYTQQKESQVSLIDSIYFSFITATSTGFGDIIPYGNFKIVAIFEVVFGLLLLAFVTSRLISIKQDVILNEIYEISFNERISRLRSSLLLFRQNINKIIDRVEANVIRIREVNDLYIHMSGLENILTEAKNIFGKTDLRSFTKVIDPISTELIFNSIVKSFERIGELIASLGNANIDWRRDITIDLIKRCIDENENLFEKLKVMHLNEKTVKELTSQKDKIIELIKIEVNPEPKKEET